MPTDAAAIDRLRVRLALLRERIERQFFCVAHIPVPSTPSTSEAFEQNILVSEDLCPGWEGENVLVWYRRDGADAWAVQAKCPHAMVTLEMSDIEDFTASFPSTQGPCIACPAHMYVIDLGSGYCLTDDETPRSRIYPVHRSGPHAAPHSSAASTSGDDTPPVSDVYCLWLGREPLEPPHSADDTKPDIDVGNQLQLELVAKGLRRRFGDDSAVGDSANCGGGDASGCSAGTSARVIGYDT